MVLKICFLLLQLLVIGILHAHGKHLSGRVVDSNTGEGVEYVNIGVKNRAGGTVSDSLGNFTLQLADTLNLMTEISFSHLSYSSVSMHIRDFKSWNSKEINHVIRLTPTLYEIDSILIVGSKKASKKLTRNGLPILGGSISYSLLGEEVGSLLKIKDCTTISNIKFHVISNSCRQVKLRLNLYRIEKDSLINILKTPTYCIVYQSISKQKIAIQPSEHIKLNEGIYYVSLEYVDFTGGGELRFPLFLSKSYTRASSMDIIQEIPFSIGLSITGYK